MYRLSFLTVRLFGFFPFTRNRGKYEISQKWLYWSYIFCGIVMITAVWRVKYYIFMSAAPTFKSFIYDLLLTYQPLLNLCYSLYILYPIYRRNNLKKLQKCLNILESIPRKSISFLEKFIYFYTIVNLVTLTLSVEVTHNLFYKIDETFEGHFDYVTTLFMSFVQSFSLMYNCIIYNALLSRLKIITRKLEDILGGKRGDLTLVVESYLKCTSLINTFHGLNFLTLRNIWLHTVYDLLCGYQGGEMYLKRFLRGERTENLAIADIATFFWEVHNVPLSFLLFNLGNRLRNQICKTLNTFSRVNDYQRNPSVTSLLIKAQHELTSNTILSHTSITEVVSALAAYLSTAEQISEYMGE